MPRSEQSYAKSESSSRSSKNPKSATHQTASPAVDASAAREPGLGQQGFNQSAFERHAALLGSPRLAHPANAALRASLYQTIQRDYGNRYVQRLVERIQGGSRAPAQEGSQHNGEHGGRISSGVSESGAGSEMAGVAVQQRTQGGPVVHRHSAYEHYLLGQVAPSKLASLPQVRQIPALEAQKKKLEAQKKEADPKEVNRVINQLEDAKAKKEEVRHTIEQEMDRLEKWMNNPEAVKVGAVEKGKVTKGEDNTWQVPYVVIPVRDDEQIVVTYSEINTLPDLFGNPEAIANTPKAKVLSLLQGVRQQSYIELDNLYNEIFGERRSKLRRKVKGVDTGTERDFEGAQGPRAQAVIGKAYEIRTESQVQKATLREGEESQSYFAALERNACHFAPQSWAQWEGYHKEARTLALESWKTREMAEDIRELGGDETIASDYEEEAAELSNQAMLQNGFGEHYLQDSFAAGHLIDKTKIMQWFTKWLNDVGKPLGSFENAQVEWSMASGAAGQDLQSNPQALDDMMHRGQIKSVEDATKAIGMKVKPEIVFMMWWRSAAKDDKEMQELSVEQAASKCRLKEVARNKKAARIYLERLAAQKYADKNKALFSGSVTYSLKDAVVNTVSGGGPYESNVAKDSAKKGEKPDFTKEAHEFDLASYNAFMSNAYIQAATKFFHDKYCREGLRVFSRGGEFINTIYGDNNMLKAGAQEGVEFSAETSQMSREAIFNMINGEPENAEAIATISSRFPGSVNDEGVTLPLDKWNESLKARGEAGLFKKAMDNGALTVYKIKGGISGGKALDMKKLTKGVEKETKVPEHDGGPF